MATSTFPTLVTGVTVETATTGALSGDGSSGDKLAVTPDGVTVHVNGSNQLAVLSGGLTPGGDPGTVQFNNAGAFDGFGSWDGTTLILNPLALSAIRLDALEDSSQNGRYDLLSDGSGAFAPENDQSTLGTSDQPWGALYVLGAATAFVATDASGYFKFSAPITNGDPYASIEYPLTAYDNMTLVPTSYYADIPDGGYALWLDDTSNPTYGLFRVRNANGQAIPALYNKDFTKYVADAPNYERIIQQWNANIAEIGTEAGGTGTLRPLKLLGPSVTATTFIGPVKFPTSDPMVRDAWWNNAGTLTISAAV